MAAYGDAAYNFELFEGAYCVVPEYREKTEVEKRREQIHLYKKGQSKSRPVPVEGKNRWRSVQVAVLCVLLFLPICSFVNARRQLDEISKNIENTRVLIADEQSERVRLNAEVNSKMTINKVEDYASNVLGMVKLSPYNVKYYDFSGEDKVLVSGGKNIDTEEETSLIAKLLSYFN